MLGIYLIGILDLEGILLLAPTAADEALCLCMDTPMFSFAKLLEKIEFEGAAFEEEPATED